jgi:hypothetical protein
VDIASQNFQKNARARTHTKGREAGRLIGESVETTKSYGYLACTMWVVGRFKSWAAGPRLDKNSKRVSHWVSLKKQIKMLIGAKNQTS